MDPSWGNSGEKSANDRVNLPRPGGNCCYSRVPYLSYHSHALGVYHRKCEYSLRRVVNVMDGRLEVETYLLWVSR